MHYVFIDERYSKDTQSTIVVAGWIVNQATLNRNSSQLQLPGKAPFLARIEAALETLDALASIGYAKLPNSIFTPGEVDRCDDIPAMARTDNVWSMAMAFVVAMLLRDLSLTGEVVYVVDLYFDPKSLQSVHLAVWEEALRSLVARVAREFAEQLGRRSFEQMKIRHIRFVPKAKEATQRDKFQLGTWIADRLCSRSREICESKQFHRIRCEDMRDDLERTVRQWHGVPFNAPLADR